MSSPSTRDAITYTTGSEITIIDKPDGTTVIEISPSSLDAFSDLVRRGSNTWDSAPREIHEFRDILLTGAIQQQYTPKK